MTQPDISKLPPILLTLYVESEVDEDLTDELHLFSVTPSMSDFLERLDSKEPMRGSEHALHSYWTRNEEGTPELRREVGMFEMGDAKWNGEFLCASIAEEGTLKEMSHYSAE